VKLLKSKTPISWNAAEELLAKNEIAMKEQTLHTETVRL
jgi:hypothetical protein